MSNSRRTSIPGNFSPTVPPAIETGQKTRFFPGVGLLVRLLYYLVLTVAVAFILFYELDLPGRSLAVPFNFRAAGADTIYELTIIQAIVREGWWWHATGLAAPTGLALAAMPIMGNLDCVVIRFFALFIDQAGLLLNLYWITTILIAGPIAAWCLIRLGVERRIAFVCGILYALSPHVYYRNTSQLQLSHHLIPLACTLACLLAAGLSERLRRGTLRVLLAGCVLIGFSYIYWAFFACFVILAGGVAGFLRRRDYRLARLCGAAVGLIVLSTALNLLPSAISWRSDPAGYAMLAFKNPSEADVFGLKIRQLITPTSQSPLPTSGKIAAKIASARFPMENENQWSSMGAAATAGFLILIVTGVFLLAPTLGPTLDLLKSLAALTLACILLGTVGGFGSLFNLFVRPDIRAYNRISIFIVFFSLAALSLVLSKTLSLVPPRAGATAGSTVLLFLLLIVGVADQNESYPFNAARAGEESTFRVLSEFVGRIERDLPRNSMVYQLPYMAYTDADTSGLRPPRIAQSEPELPFLFSRSLRWSFPAISREAITSALVVNALGAADMVDLLRDRGFFGIHVDRFGYTDDGKVLVAQLRDYLAREPIQSADGRYVFFNLGSGPFPRENRRHYAWGTMLSFTSPVAPARYLVEGWSCVGCTEGKASTMLFGVTDPKADVAIKARLMPALFGNLHERTVHVIANSVPVGVWKVRGLNWYSVTVPRKLLENKNHLFLRFELPDAASPESLGMNNDRRVLSVAFDQLVLGNISHGVVGTSEP